jgi:hypothetical protein
MKRCIQRNGHHLALSPIGIYDDAEISLEYATFCPLNLY